MKALVFEDNKLRLDTNHPKPEPVSRESLVKVLFSGICNTDIEIVRGYMGFQGILGHEFIGIVEESDNPDLIGKRVVGEINCPCHNCIMCRKRMPGHCIDRTVLGIQGRNGSMADYLVLPEENLHVVPDNIPDEDATFVEPLAAAFEITQHHYIRPRDKVLLIGAGKLGKLIAQVLALTGCSLTVAGKHRKNLAFIKEMGIETVLVKNLEKHPAFDYVVEASGSPSGFETARSAVFPRGTIIQKSTYADNPELNLSMLVVDEITLAGSRCGPFEPAIRALSSGRIKVRPLISGVYKIDDAAKAFEEARKSGMGKILIRFS